MKLDKFDIIVVPFPFTDQPITKKRPAIVISSKKFNQKIEHSVCAMITSSKNELWPNDLEIVNIKDCGLPAASKIRMKFFTIDHKLILNKIGALKKSEQTHLDKQIAEVMSLNIK